MGSIGTPELIVIAVLALLVFGPKRLPEIGRNVGAAIREFRKASRDIMSHFEEDPYPRARSVNRYAYDRDGYGASAATNGYEADDYSTATSGPANEPETYSVTTTPPNQRGESDATMTAPTEVGDSPSTATPALETVPAESERKA
jgi:TatA/E family protein of Tat protein translocase